MSLQKTRFTFLHNDLAHLFPANEAMATLTLKPRLVYDVLHNRGAMFYREILAHTDMLSVELEQVLIQLIKQGLIVADGFQALRVFSQTPAERRQLLLKAKRVAHHHGYLEMMGRWSVIRQHQAEAVDYVKIMLNRYGILSYDLWHQEDMPVKWRQAAYECQRMEARGELLAGRFINGLSGMQYALPEVYQRLRSLQSVN
jgi:ATP-dependent Lhr-like helicase